MGRLVLGRVVFRASCLGASCLWGELSAPGSDRCCILCLTGVKVKFHEVKLKVEIVRLALVGVSLQTSLSHSAL